MALVIFASYPDFTFGAMAVVEDGGRIHTPNPRLKAALMGTKLNAIEDTFSTQSYMVGKFSNEEAIQILEKAGMK